MAESVKKQENEFDPEAAKEALRKRLETSDDQPIVPPNANPGVVNTVIDTRTGEVVATSGQSEKPQ